MKVIYILVWLISFSAIALISYGSRPYTVKDNYYVTINCDSGNSYKHRLTNGFYGDTPDFTYDETEQLKKVCAYGLNDDNITKPAIDTVNFKYDFLYNSYGSWKGVITSIAVGFLIAFIVIEGVKSMLLYIIGLGVWRGMLLYTLFFLAGMLTSNKERGNK